MDVSTNGHTGPGPEHGELAPGGWKSTLVRGLGVLAFLAMVGFWIWAFNNRDSIAHPDTFDDPVYTEAAEGLCAKRQTVIAEIPATISVSDPVARGELVAQRTAQLELMLGDLAALPSPTDPKGADGVVRWLADYDLYLSDLRDYQQALEAGEDPQFLLSATSGGARVTDVIGTYAEVNNMVSCTPKGEI